MCCYDKILVNVAAYVILSLVCVVRNKQEQHTTILYLIILIIHNFS
jgi:hypothetical protein